MEVDVLCNLYSAFSSALSFPNDKTNINKLLQVLRKMDKKIEKNLREKFEAVSLESLQTFYTNTFDVGVGGPPCPLYEGHYRPDRLKTFEELLRFYSFFDLKPKGAELPDHICVELECLYYLAVLEKISTEKTKNGEMFRRARRDFIKRHVLYFVEKIVEKLERNKRKEAKLYLMLFRNLQKILESEVKE